MPASPFLPRWKEASGANAACGSCESGGFESASSSSGVVGAGASTGAWGSGSGSGGSLAHPGRKIRDVTHTESKMIKNNCLTYLILYKKNLKSTCYVSQS